MADIIDELNVIDFREASDLHKKLDKAIKTDKKTLMGSLGFHRLGEGTDYVFSHVRLIQNHGRNLHTYVTHYTSTRKDGKTIEILHTVRFIKTKLTPYVKSIDCVKIND